MKKANTTPSLSAASAKPAPSPAAATSTSTTSLPCRKGYASRLLEEVRKISAETGVTKIHLNVHVNHDRTDAHRLYFKNGFEICAYHFRCDPK
ncbi:exported hypothetical protein [Neisseria gonorrhoeae]|nr:exported hypothetical protein [Neisseria gonorrhoeae]